ncbi:MAG: response regulator [Elusimicrobia bacterium]|nr:response regulator [Elusimicrobiota bacterium]
MPSSKFILVVDDDVTLAQVVVEYLESKGYKATWTTDAWQTVIQAEALRPKLIICDIRLPVWGTGVDAYRNFRKNRFLKSVPVIFITGLNAQEARPLVPIEDPLVRLLYKPLDMGQLEKAIDEFLGEKRPAPAASAPGGRSAGGPIVPLDLDADLEPVYRLELALGNVLERVDNDDPACGRAKTYVFRSPLHFNEIRGQLKLPDTLRLLEAVPEFPFSGLLSSKSLQLVMGPCQERPSDQGKGAR